MNFSEQLGWLTSAQQYSHDEHHNERNQDESYHFDIEEVITPAPAIYLSRETARVEMRVSRA